MACFLVPAAEAVVVTIVEKAREKKEKTEAVSVNGETKETGKIPWSRKLKWLMGLLWGGAALLAFEHIWHGEVVPWFPFLTAASDPASASEMLHEMATAGVCMAVLVTAVWICMCFAADAIAKRQAKEETL